MKPDMAEIVDASYAIWQLDKLGGARVVWKCRMVRGTWELRWRENWQEYTAKLVKEKSDVA